MNLAPLESPQHELIRMALMEAGIRWPDDFWFTKSGMLFMDPGVDGRMAYKAIAFAARLIDPQRPFSCQEHGEDLSLPGPCPGYTAERGARDAANGVWLCGQTR